MYGTFGAALDSFWLVGVTVAHRLVAALMLATSLVLVLWTYRLSGAVEPVLRRAPASGGMPA